MREGAIKKEQPCKTISAHQAKGQTAVRYSPKRAGGPQRCTKHTATPRCQYTRIRTVAAKRVVKRKRTGQQTTDGVESVAIPSVATDPDAGGQRRPGEQVWELVCCLSASSQNGGGSESRLTAVIFRAPLWPAAHSRPETRGRPTAG